ncbi:MAG: endonuclease domain-containing protein [Sphingopyxis sp.]
MWRALREAFPPAKFRRQQALGPYFADFASHAARLVIEIDGGQHGEAVAYDEARTRFITGEGYKVIRFWNDDVMTNLEGVLTSIASTLPSPLVGKGGPQGRMRGNEADTPLTLPRLTPWAPPSPTRGEGNWTEFATGVEQCPF